MPLGLPAFLTPVPRSVIRQQQRDATVQPDPSTQPTAEEAALTARIVALTHEEQKRRSTVGNGLLLVERYIYENAKVEDSDEYKRLQFVTGEITRLLAIDNEKGGRYLTGAGIKARKMMAEQTQLELWVERHSRYFTLGAKVHEIRKQREELVTKRDELKAERLATATT